jgi:crotonyl-CoA carboxylase/reductase
MEAGRIQPFLSKVYPYDQIPQAHQDMFENKHIGNMTTQVMAPKEGLIGSDDLKAACD